MLLIIWAKNGNFFQKCTEKPLTAWTIQGWRWSAMEKYFVCHVLHVLFSFDAGAGVVLGGGWPKEGSAELDVECD